MKNIIKNIIYAFTVIFIVTYCTNNVITDSGGASETIAIVIIGSNIYGEATKLSEENIESANPDVIVSLFEIDYLPFPFLELNVNNFTNKTSSVINGEFQFTNVKTGYYNIYAKDTITGKAVLFDSIAVFRGVEDTIYDSLTYPGSFAGYVNIISSNNDTSNAVGYDVYIPGSHFATVTDIDGAYSLDSLPVGWYNVLSMSLSILMDSIKTDNPDTLMNILNNADGNTVSVKSKDTQEGVNIYIQ